MTFGTSTNTDAQLFTRLLKDDNLLHPGRRWIPAYQHPNLLLVGQQRSHGFLVCGVTQVDAVHLQDSISNTQATLTGQTVRDHLTKKRNRSAGDEGGRDFQVRRNFKIRYL